MTDASSAYRGPYVSDARDIWLPTDAWTWNEAQAEARTFAIYEDGGESAIYVGIEEVGCHDHEEPWDEDCCQRRAYHFRSVER